MKRPSSRAALPVRAEHDYRLTADERGRWLALIHSLKRELPAAQRVVVRTCRTAGDLCGDATQLGAGSDAKFRIRISQRLTWGERIDTLVHEYAHCLAWSYHHDQATEPHDETWGVWYAKAYCVAERCLTVS